MTQRLDARLDRNTPAALSVFRIFFGLLFLFEGLSKVFDWPAQLSIPTGTWPYWYAGILELVLGSLITLGLFTRIAAFIACGQMAVAYFTEHIEKSFWPVVNGGELAVAMCFGFLLLVFTGGGAYALDSARGRR
ncbi:DoxX family protein [uncultured Mycobacterium sp.]|uniref:DoxX family protein n=1 Tax=uncultured Mycobacterium sp. TaxID=171292 RepID=A0A1Y5PGU7_9MYCO|nr:DoxX family protein [uncultured Mycobacterium sp.]